MPAGTVTSLLRAAQVAVDPVLDPLDETELTPGEGVVVAALRRLLLAVAARVPGGIRLELIGPGG